MNRLREKITPGNWRITVWISLPIIMVLFLLSALFPAVMVPILLLVLVLFPVGTFLFWRCPSCGRLLPENLLFSFAKHCPHCGDSFDL